MTIDYAKAYTKERLAEAETKRLMQQAVLSQRASRGIGSLRAGVGGWLIKVGERLLGVHTLGSPALARVETSR